MTPNIFSLYVFVYVSPLSFSTLATTKMTPSQHYHHGLHFAAISQPNRLDILPHCAASSLTTRVRMYAHLYRSCTSQLRPEAFVCQPIAHMNCVHHHPGLSAQRQPIYEQAVSVALCTPRDCFVIWGNEIWIADDSCHGNMARPRPKDTPQGRHAHVDTSTTHFGLPAIVKL